MKPKRKQKDEKWFIEFTLFLLYILISYSHVNGQNQNFIYKLENPNFSLKKRILITLKQTLQENFKKRIWIGYVIKKKTAKNNIHVKYKIDKLTLNRPSLKQLLNGEDFFHKSNKDEKTKVLRTAILLALDKLGKANVLKELREVESNHNSIVIEELAILMDYSLESGRPKLYQIFITPTEQAFNFEGRNLYWLGNITQEESVDWLRYLFHRNSYLKLRRQLLTSISYHASLPQIFQLLNDIVLGKFDLKLKEDSIFQLGQRSSRLSDYLLCKIITNSEEINLIKKAIIALSQSKNDKALKVISLLAKKSTDKDIKKEAIFSLGQMHNKKSLFVLHEIVVNDKDTDIKEFAVFVISQIPDKNTSYILKHISKTHPDANVREKALYWLDKSDNKQALNYLIDISHNID